MIGDVYSRMCKFDTRECELIIFRSILQALVSDHVERPGLVNRERENIEGMFYNNTPHAKTTLYLVKPTLNMRILYVAEDYRFKRRHCI